LAKFPHSDNPVYQDLASACWNLPTCDCAIKRTMSKIPDLDAPIIPGKSAAGIAVGSTVKDFILRAVPTLTTELSSGVVRYEFGPVVKVWVRDGVVDQVGVYVGYHGLLDGKIGIGSTIAEIEDWCGSQVEEDEEDNLIAPGRPGWCFDTEYWVGDLTVSTNRNAAVNQICVLSIKPQRG
jgi:hypothetical protein